MGKHDIFRKTKIKSTLLNQTLRERYFRKTQYFDKNQDQTNTAESNPEGDILGKHDILMKTRIKRTLSNETLRKTFWENQ